jgi:hypothetical protein
VRVAVGITTADFAVVLAATAIATRLLALAETIRVFFVAFRADAAAQIVRIRRRIETGNWLEAETDAVRRATARTADLRLAATHCRAFAIATDTFLVAAAAGCSARCPAANASALTALAVSSGAALAVFFALLANLLAVGRHLPSARHRAESAEAHADQRADDGAARLSGR